MSGDDACFARNRWPNVALEPVVFYDGGTIVAGALVMVQKFPLGLGKMAIVKWGPTLRREGRDNGANIYHQCIRLLIAEFAQRRGMVISIMPRASKTRLSAEIVVSENEEQDALERMGFKRGADLKFPDRYIVNLRQDDVELRSSFAQKWRYHLKKSEKESLTFEHVIAHEKLTEFDALYQAMTDRKRFPDYSAYHTVEQLVQGDVPALLPEMFFVRKDGEAVAGALIFKAGDTAVYLYGATNDKALPLRAGYYMHWHIIRWLRDNTRATWYDLGGTDGFQGLHQFKKGMVGDTGLITPVPPIMNYASSPITYGIGVAAYAARDWTQQGRKFVNWVRSDLARPNQER